MKKKKIDEIMEKIVEWQKDPDFIRAADEFVRKHT